MSTTKKSSLVFTMGWRRGLRVSKAGVVVTFSILANLLQDFKTPGDESDGGVQRTALGPVQEANLAELCWIPVSKKLHHRTVEIQVRM